jgi:hypothetical protein
MFDLKDFFSYLFKELAEGQLGPEEKLIRASIRFDGPFSFQLNMFPDESHRGRRRVAAIAPP